MFLGHVTALLLRHLPAAQAPIYSRDATARSTNAEKKSPLGNALMLLFRIPLGTSSLANNAVVATVGNQGSALEAHQ